jgi:copper chaperone CopZ
MITTLQIDGMRTVHCVRAVYTSLAGVAGIDAAEVSMGQATLEHAQALDAAALTAAVAIAGYTVRAIGTQRRGLPTLPATVAPDAPADE